MMLLRDVVWLGIVSKLSLLSPYTTSRSISSLFEYPLPPFLGAKAERTQSEGRAKAKWRQPSVIILPRRTKIRVPLLRKKKWHKVALDNNNNRDETTVHTQFTVYKANTMTDSHIRPSVNCELQ